MTSPFWIVRGAVAVVEHREQRDVLAHRLRHRGPARFRCRLLRHDQQAKVTRRLEALDRSEALRACERRLLARGRPQHEFLRRGSKRFLNRHGPGCYAHRPCRRYHGASGSAARSRVSACAAARALRSGCLFADDPHIVGGLAWRRNGDPESPPPVSRGKTVARVLPLLLFVVGLLIVVIARQQSMRPRSDRVYRPRANPWGFPGGAAGGPPTRGPARTGWSRRARSRACATPTPAQRSTPTRRCGDAAAATPATTGKASRHSNRTTLAGARCAAATTCARCRSSEQALRPFPT